MTTRDEISQALFVANLYEAAQVLRERAARAETAEDAIRDEAALAQVEAQLREALGEDVEAPRACNECERTEGHHPACPDREDEDAAVEAAERAVEDGLARWSETGSSRRER